MVRKAGSAGIGWAVYEGVLGWGERSREVPVAGSRSGGG